MATIQDIFDWLNQGAQGDIPGTGGEQPSPTPSSNPYSQSSVPGTQDSPSSGGAPGSADKNSFWNQNQIAPYNPPGQADDRVPPTAASMTYRMPQQGISNLGGDDLSNLLSQYHVIATTPPGEDIQFDKEGMHVTGSDPDPWTPPKGDAVSPDAYKGTSQPSPQDYSGDIPPSLMGQYDQLIKNGIPPSVARYMLTEPSYAEGQRPHSTPQWTPPQQYLGGQPDPKTGKAVDSISPYPGDPTDYDQLLSGIFSRQTWDKQNLPVPEDNPYYYDPSGLMRLPTGQYAPPAMTPQPGSKSALDYYRSLGDPSSFWWNPQPNTFWGNNLLYGQQAQQGGANQGWQ